MIGERLKSERMQLGAVQDGFAQTAGVSRRTVLAWEKGEQTPSAEFLAKLAVAGVDVLYVVTGTRSSLQMQFLGAQLTDEEAEMLTVFRSAPAEFRRSLSQIAAGLARGSLQPDIPART
ncbi:helix-turn-helix transcriptional regulator [uncultured Xylophilus sp.]|uniref:helix-turn-helix domain-containing protein n=1 Tax=uncultured Xylophilus sp. TaxID=296832 RepID=UPI0025CCDDCF|nr:helix-turn-helix transcriptional regulator [uncultured Xylophilus sp.]